MPERFTEEEARRVFVRAAEAVPVGLSRAELGEIGRAAGLDPASASSEAQSVPEAPLSRLGLDALPDTSAPASGTESRNRVRP